MVRQQTSCKNKQKRYTENLLRNLSILQLRNGNFQFSHDQAKIVGQVSIFIGKCCTTAGAAI